MGSSVILPAPGQPVTGPDPNFKTGAIPNIVTYDFQSIDPPSPLYIQRDDQLFLFAISNQAGQVVTVNGRLLLAPAPRGGQPDATSAGSALDNPNSSNVIVPFTTQISLPVVGASVTKLLALAEGYLLSLDAVAVGSSNRGMTFVRANILHGGATAFAAALPLFADYVGTNHAAGFPGGRYIWPSEGPGWLHSVQVANPAAGADWSFLAAGSPRIRVTSLNAVLTTSVTVANRQVQLIVDDGANVVGVFGAGANITASLTTNVTGTTGSFSTAVVTTDLLIPLPSPLFLPFGWHIKTSTVGLQAGDQWSAIWLALEEQLDGA